MNTNKKADLLGVSRLTLDAIMELTHLVEAMHLNIATLGGLIKPPSQVKTRGITGFIYENIRWGSDLIRSNINLAIQKHSSSLTGPCSSSTQREMMLAILNGILGDHLSAEQNPLAIKMQIRRAGIPIQRNIKMLIEQFKQQQQKKIVLMIHGSCMNDLQWNRNKDDYGAKLAQDLGYIPLYLHYNTGQHISENGRRLSTVLENLFCQLNSNHPIELIIIAHSMGGLVSRSACHIAQLEQKKWLNHLKKIFFLGTPHQGAPLEKAGNLFENMLQLSPYTAPLSHLGKIRSVGVTDLRHGTILEEDWQFKDRFKITKDNRSNLLLPEKIQHYAIAATRGKAKYSLGNHLMGDGLVTLNSALGLNKNKKLSLKFPSTHQKIIRNTSHIELINSPEVYQTILHWLNPTYE